MNVTICALVQLLSEPNRPSEGLQTGGQGRNSQREAEGQGENQCKNPFFHGSLLV